MEISCQPPSATIPGCAVHLNSAGPQIILSGLIVPTDQMPGVMETLSIVLPLTYAVERLRGIMVMRQSLADVWADLLVLAGFGVGLLVAAVDALR